MQHWWHGIDQVLHDLSWFGINPFATTLIGKDIGIEHRLGRQEFLVEQGTRSYGFPLVVEADAGDDFGSMADEVSEMVIIQDDQMRHERIACQVVRRCIGKPCRNLGAVGDMFKFEFFQDDC